ncbi:hypothetical protein [uncultured Maribacter sp.]|uniref:hypothetical protein n=1 Tax=uncultured Maribacter sp. TaxID=431308 RepID=UPI0026396E8F|nr:hypothetical protein [uncultured Maribacter sp.]
MKLLTHLIIFLCIGVCRSQDFIDTRISCAKYRMEEKMIRLCSKELFTEHFYFEKSKTLIETYNEIDNKLERIRFSEFKDKECHITQLWLYYKVMDENLVLTELSIPINLNCSSPWSWDDTKEIIEPYLIVLKDETKIDLKKALEIGVKNGLDNIYEWDIDFEKRKLIWTIKSELEKGRSKVIKINSKNGKIQAEYIEIPID